MGTSEMEITQINQLNPKSYFTYVDYLSWRFKERVELFKGKLVRMSPAPSRNHQKISGIIFYELYKFLEAKPYEVYSAPFDVRLPVSKKAGKVDTVVQPDICVICNLDILDEAGCNGAPDLVIEILSPSNTEKELGIKFELYEESLVKEYWIVRPHEKNVTAYVLNHNNQFISQKTHIIGQTISSATLKGFDININEIFDDKKS